jgi:hypothetical protein
VSSWQLFCGTIAFISMVEVVVAVVFGNKTQAEVESEQRDFDRRMRQ